MKPAFSKTWVAVATVVLGIVGVFAAPQSEAAEIPANSAPQRIVSLAPSVTEILFALGLGERLVGATDYCNYPAAAKQLPRIGSLGNPNMEQVIVLRPDLVIASGFTRNDTAATLRRMGIRAVDVTISNFTELFTAIGEIGRETGTLTAAEALIKSARAELEKTTQRSAQLAPAQRQRVFVEIWHDPLTTVGNRSFLDDMITRAGGINVAGDLPQAYLRVSQETVVTWNPDVIIAAYMGRGRPAVAQIAGRLGWAGIAAVKSGRILDDIPNDLLLRPGPRLVEGVKVLAERLYPIAERQDRNQP